MQCYPTSRPMMDSSNACNHVPLRRPVRFAIIRGITLVWHMFPPPKKKSFPSGIVIFTPCHHTLCSSDQAHSSSQTASRSVQPLLWVSNAMLYNALSMGKKTRKNCPSSWDFVTVLEEVRATAISNMHIQFASVVSKISSQTDRHTHTHSHRRKVKYTSICRAHFYAKRLKCAQTWITSPPFGWHSFYRPTYSLQYFATAPETRG